MPEQPEPSADRSIQQDTPAAPDVETREETIARVVGEEEAVGAERGGSPDPSTRRGVQRTLWGAIAVGAGAGFVVGAIAGLVLSLAPGPVETDSVGAALGYTLGLGAAVAIVGAMLTALLTLAREDGRIERQVEHETGAPPQGPGRPGSPEHDLEPR